MLQGLRASGFRRASGLQGFGAPGPRGLRALLARDPRGKFCGTGKFLGTGIFFVTPAKFWEPAIFLAPATWKPCVLGACFLEACFLDLRPHRKSDRII